MHATTRSDVYQADDDARREEHGQRDIEALVSALRACATCTNVSSVRSRNARTAERAAVPKIARTFHTRVALERAARSSIEAIVHFSSFVNDDLFHRINRWLDVPHVRVELQNARATLCTTCRALATRESIFVHTISAQDAGHLGGVWDLAYAAFATIRLPLERLNLILRALLARTFSRHIRKGANRTWGAQCGVSFCRKFASLTLFAHRRADDAFARNALRVSFRRHAVATTGRTDR